jgi:hypothetical protein
LDMAALLLPFCLLFSLCKGRHVWYQVCLYVCWAMCLFPRKKLWSRHYIFISLDKSVVPLQAVRWPCLLIPFPDSTNMVDLRTSMMWGILALFNLESWCFVLEWVFEKKHSVYFIKVIFFIMQNNKMVTMWNL